MQKWCPDPLTSPKHDSSLFEKHPPIGATNPSMSDMAFRPESGFSTGEALLKSLSREERIQVAKLIEQDLRGEFERRWQAETAARDAQVAEEAGILNAWKESLSLQLQQAMQASLSQFASRISEFTVLMAAKVVRREVELDPEILVRNLETVLYKANAGSALTVTVHPDDASWLAAAPDVLDRCRIKEIKEDRRLDRGGCLIKADEVEWDATISGQLAALGEVLATELSVPPSQVGSDEHA